MLLRVGGAEHMYVPVCEVHVPGHATVSSVLQQAFEHTGSSLGTSASIGEGNVLNVALGIMDGQS